MHVILNRTNYIFIYSDNNIFFFHEFVLNISKKGEQGVQTLLYMTAIDINSLQRDRVIRKIGIITAFPRCDTERVRSRGPMIHRKGTRKPRVPETLKAPSLARAQTLGPQACTSQVYNQIMFQQSRECWNKVAALTDGSRYITRYIFDPGIHYFLKESDFIIQDSRETFINHDPWQFGLQQFKRK